MHPSHPPLGDLSPTEFLRQYWQKRPLLVRGAWPDYRSPIEPDELAGLACEAQIESRLVLENSGNKPWELRHGPFREADFAALPANRWTLLVQELNKYIPEAALLLDAFGFIPGWRVDDLMVSYAEDGGSVGPHVDQYDVFLLQAQGRRRWQISTEAVGADNYLPDTELRIMRDFSPQQAWLVEPGDLLYLPPGVAHHGVAEGPCMTFSIGFRAPALRGLVETFAEQAAERLDPDSLYTDPELEPQPHSGAISPHALQRVRELIRAALTTDDRSIDTWFARQMSLPQRGEPSQPRQPPVSGEQFMARLEAGEILWRSDYSRFSFLDHGSDGLTLCVDGRDQHLDAELLPAVAMLTGQRRLHYGQLASELHHPALGKLLTDLYNRSALFFADDE